MSAGDIYSCGLRFTGEVECWSIGSNSSELQPSGEFTEVHIGHDSYICGLRPGGEVECWSGQSSVFITTDVRLKRLDHGRNPCGITLDDRAWCHAFTWPASNPLICEGPEEFVF